MSLGENIKANRKKAGLTQVELAEKANISRSYLGDLERDRYNASLDTLERIANALNLTSSVILEGKEPYLYKYDTDKQETIDNILSTLRVLSDDEGYFLSDIQYDVFISIFSNLYMAHAFHDSSTDAEIKKLIEPIWYYKENCESSPEGDVLYDEDVEEIKEAYNYRTVKTALVHNELDNLEKFLEEIKGLVKPQYGEEIVLTNQVKVPVLGSVAAGLPIERIEHIEGYEMVEKGIVRGREVFGLKVKGDSMIGDGIFNGDTVIVVKQTDITPSDIAIVAVNGYEATLKRVKCENGVCMLIPSNPNMQPFLEPAKNVFIIGKVIQSRRSFE